MARVPAELGRQVIERAGVRCEYCGLPQEETVQPFHIEHIIALKHHGETVFHNLAFACFDCNVFKGSNVGGIDQVTGGLVRLFHPRVDDWHEHFKLDENGLIQARTSVGRVTVDVLRINRGEAVELRHELLRDDRW